MHHVFLGLGGNIGNKQQNFEKVKLYIEKEIGAVADQSLVYETPPWGFLAEDYFWNQVIRVNTIMEPEELIVRIQKIEKLFGRKRDAGYYVSREMDIDVLYYDDITITSDKLIVPHPKIEQRLFVLVPLNELAPNYEHPVLKMTNLQLLDNCKDDSSIKRIDL